VVNLELFRLSANSHTPPQYLETFNKPARADVNEICIREMYQFGKLDCFKSICITDVELKHILALLSNNTLQNQKGLDTLNQMILTDGISQLTKVDASRKKKVILVDTDVTNNIILLVQSKIQELNKELELTKRRKSFEIEVTKREIFIMYFVLDMAHIVDLYNERSDIQIDGQHDFGYIAQKERKRLTESARQKLSVFFNPSMQYERVSF
jgi:hypothetical protein